MRKPLRRPGTIAVPAFLLIAAACESGDAAAPLAPEPASLPAEVSAFVSEMNAHRTGVGCAALVWNEQVAEVAQAHSVDMVERDYFSHTNPDGESPFQRLTAAGIQFSGAAENIAWGYPTGTAVLSGWLNSPGHRANIENCSLTQHGVGLEGTHWTHVFIRP